MVVHSCWKIHFIVMSDLTKDQKYFKHILNGFEKGLKEKNLKKRKGKNLPHLHSGPKAQSFPSPFPPLAWPSNAAAAPQPSAAAAWPSSPTAQPNRPGRTRAHLLGPLTAGAHSSVAPLSPTSGRNRAGLFPNRNRSQQAVISCLFARIKLL